MKKGLVLFFIISLSISTLGYAQDCSNNTLDNSTLAGAAPFCSDTGLTFCNSLLLVDQGILDIDDIQTSAEPGPEYDCLGLEPYPSWFFIRIDEPGSLDLTISQFNTNGIPIDVDFIIWGPYTQAQINSIQGGNTSLLGPAAVQDCSYLPDAVEFLSVDPVVSGEYYVILITNFAQDAGTIEMVSTNSPGPGVGSTDCSIIAGDLGQDQDVCEGEIVILDATPSPPEDVDYAWFVDDGSGFVEIAGQTNATLEIGGASVPAVSGTYRVVVTDMDGNIDDDEVDINFYPQPTINSLADPIIEQCDDDGNNDGLHFFDLTIYSNEFMGAAQTSAGTFEVIYFNSEADALANTNPIGNPNNYQNSSGPFATDEIWARVVNTASPNTCNAVVSSFELLVQSVPDIQNTSDYEECDENTDGDDTNGFVQTFVLSTKDQDILGLTQDIADYTVTYYLSASDADGAINALDKINPIQNPVEDETDIFVRVENNTTGCYSISDNSLFSLVVNPLPQVTDPVLLQECDDDQNGRFVFDLTEANPLISSDYLNEFFRYYPTETDAQNNSNEITNPTSYESLVPTNDAVWARTITVNGCYRVSRINLQVSNTVIPVTYQRTYDQCDDYLDINGNNNSNNDDTDGVSTFDFSSSTAEIIGLFPSDQTISISYYETLANANNAINPIPDISSHRNINSPISQDIYIRVENPANNTCLYVGTHITLLVGEVPEALPALDMDICDDNSDGDDTNGSIQNIDLESQNSSILGSQDPANFTVTYHESEVDATAGANPLASPFSNTVANAQTIYVRVTDNISGCYTDRTSFLVNIRPLPVITNSVELQQCDNDTDGFSAFNLNEAATDISSNYLNETFEFYESLSDAQSGTNAITNTTAYTNQTVSTDTVWARAISSFGCFRIAEVTLTVSTTGLPVSFQRSFEVCDDYLDINGNDNSNNDDADGVSAFDFSSVTQEVIDIFPSNQQLTVTYYRNEADALAEENPITDPSNYRNIGYPDSQQIYIRVDSDLDNDCLGFGPFINLTVDPVPVANPVSDLELCDDANDGDFTNGFVQTFDLSSQTPMILGTQDPAVYTVTYHLTRNDAATGANAISNPSMYENATVNQQTIYVRVTHSTQGCYTDRTSFDLIVNPLPESNFVEDLQICDDNSDGDPRNGLSQAIDLEVQTSTILGSQDPSQFTLTYHTSLTDAQLGNSPITGLFSNTDPFTQTIYVRVNNQTTGCANGISNFRVIVNPEPVAANVPDLLVCDDDLDGDDTNGFVQNIDLDAQILGILDFDNTGQDEDDFTVTFHESQDDATNGMNPLSSPFSNTIANQQSIYVRIVNDDTGCMNDDFSFQVIINPLPDFSVTSPQTVCINDPDLTLSVENPAGIYDYVWTDPEGNTVIGSQIDATVGGVYSVTGTSTDGTNCARTLEVRVIESIIATIGDDDVAIIDDSDNNSIQISTENLGIGDYEFALNDENGVLIRNYQDDALFENLEGGFYTVLVRDKNGCGVARLDVSIVVFPKFFTPNNDGVNDTWAIKGANSTFFPESEINIFNRFGKVVAQIDIDNPGWDGTFNGKTLPSDDYWFSIRLVDRNGVVRKRQGNMSLLRR